MRRTGGFSREEQIDQLYMHPEYKLHVRLDDVTSLSDLSARASEYEAIEKQRRELRSKRRITPTSPRWSLHIAEKSTVEGTSRGATLDPIARGRRGSFAPDMAKTVLTRNCHPFSGNATGTGKTPWPLSPHQILRNVPAATSHNSMTFQQRPYNALIYSGSKLTYINAEVSQQAELG